jgi:hypothetical protein
VRCVSTIGTGYITAKHVQFESKRTETFGDLSLDVKECGDLLTSLRRYVAEEQLTGELVGGWVVVVVVVCVCVCVCVCERERGRRNAKDAKLIGCWPSTCARYVL